MGTKKNGMGEYLAVRDDWGNWWFVDDENVEYVTEYTNDENTPAFFLTEHEDWLQEKLDNHNEYIDDERDMPKIVLMHCIWRVK